MTTRFNGREHVRRVFGSVSEVASMPNLIEVQRASYDQFLQVEQPETGRVSTGLQSCFESVFPIQDYSDRALLEFVNYQFDLPKFDMLECQMRGMTFASGLRVTLRLIVFDVDEDTGSRSVKDIKEQDIYLGDVPFMTDNGTFVVNGTERVIVSQMHRSPGVFFDHDKGKSHSSGKLLFAARIIPYRGSWLDFEFDHKDILFCRIDRRRKIPATIILKALGMDAEAILDTYFRKEILESNGSDGWKVPFVAAHWTGRSAPYDFIDANTGELLVPAGKRLTSRMLKTLNESNVDALTLSDDVVIGRYIAEDLVNKETGEIYKEAGNEIDQAALDEIRENGLTFLPVIVVDNKQQIAYIRNTNAVDRCSTREEALFEIYRVMRPGEPPTLETSAALFEGMFFDPERYDLSDVGRVKINMRLQKNVDESVCILQHEDIVDVIRTLVELRDGHGEVDDIDHLGNRRVRSVGELMENQTRLGLLRMERAIRERMSSINVDALMPQDLVNAKPVAAAIREFFGSSQLSQFMDQTNPLSEVTHKRRLSALGPGGLTRERAGFEVRDVHPTHYGRICPIETPEGPNIGLINSLATYARVNRYGFIESPYRRVVDGRVSDDVLYLSATEEVRYTIAQANINLNEEGYLVDELVVCRKTGDVIMAPPDRVDFMDVSPKQLVSVAAALIPFLENDDANRALMGSNMQRQAVPLLRSSAPLVGTGMEKIVARDSGASISARRTGVVDQVDSSRIVVRATEEKDPTRVGVDIYSLMKFKRSNQNTCINQKPLVRRGEVVRAGEIIADGPATEMGDLALGQNVMVAFMPWNGYNFEDSILLSERMVIDDVFTSIHIEEFQVMARDTKLGPEEITRDIPNVSEEALKNLDETGIIYIGAELEPGSVLVGKITPKGESPMTPEEKLLRAIFGEKASDVRDTSLRLPPGASGTVVEVQVFNRHGVEKDERALTIEREEIARFDKDRRDELEIFDRNAYERLRGLLDGKVLASALRHDAIRLKAGDALSREILDALPRSQLWRIGMQDDAVMVEIEASKQVFDEVRKTIIQRFQDKVEKIQRGDEMPPSVMKMAKVFVAIKRKIQPGDKMAGRHGNKGVVSRIVPVEDMPFLEDGTPVDIVLNPLGVPSRMNVGQILETHLGWACHNLGRQIGDLVNLARRSKDYEPLRDRIAKLFPRVPDIDQMSDGAAEVAADQLVRGVPIATPVFDGAQLGDIEQLLEDAGLNSSGQVTLFDGRTGEAFDRPVTVGMIYVLKLGHMVDDKIHARSVGPYSLVTQQPLGGKAQFGGQRFGEMEVWALEAYGASYTLQEMLTVKSDDVAGRTKVYESIVRGEDTFQSGVPESFNVLIKEMHGLGLNIELKQSQYSNVSTTTPEDDALAALESPGNSGQNN